MDALELELHLLAQPVVESAQRLVQQEHLGLVHDGPRHSHTLLLAPRKLMGLSFLHAAELDDRKGFAHLLTDERSVELLHSEAEGDVVEYGHVGKERVALEHGIHVALVRGGAAQRGAVHDDFTLVERLETGDQAENSGLSAAGRTQESEELPLEDIQVQRIDGDDIVKPLRHPP